MMPYILIFSILPWTHITRPVNYTHTLLKDIVCVALEDIWTLNKAKREPQELVIAIGAVENGQYSGNRV